ncbi:hypothetical protein RhiirA4_412198 [Rhizophagus irregularis]|uniref:Uncharacterized protein n=1 Tax=Rhizophagus irregularis TaxID=588596 RepID=A0A2I1HID2_9GLOM|nr:hypothetical protein RhiirA4_412198 [Rhizophagus irregularis]
MRTPGLYLHANNSKLHPRFTGNWKGNVGIDAIGDGLLLNKWYHITYTLSDREKRMDICNFRYFNWRLSAEEVTKNYLNHRPFY